MSWIWKLLVAAVAVVTLAIFVQWVLPLVVVFAIGNSHIEGNVPKPEHFHQYLGRDLRTYFCADRPQCSVRYELLRNGPTQSGVSYPKFYLWVTITERGRMKSGAV